MPSRTSLSHPRQSALSRIARCHRAPVSASPGNPQAALSRIARCHRAPVSAIPGNPLCPVLRDSIAHQSQPSQAIRFVQYCAIPSRTSPSHPKQSALSRIARCHRAPVPPNPGYPLCPVLRDAIAHQSQPAQAIRFVPYCAMPSRTSLSHPRHSALSRIARCHRAPVTAIPGYPLCPVLRDAIAHQSQSSPAIRNIDILMPMRR